MPSRQGASPDWLVGFLVGFVGVATDALVDVCWCSRFNSVGLGQLVMVWLGEARRR